MDCTPGFRQKQYDEGVKRITELKGSFLHLTKEQQGKIMDVLNPLCIQHITVRLHLIPIEIARKNSDLRTTAKEWRIRRPQIGPSYSNTFDSRTDMIKAGTLHHDRIRVTVLLPTRKITRKQGTMHGWAHCVWLRMNGWIEENRDIFELILFWVISRLWRWTGFISSLQNHAIVNVLPLRGSNASRLDDASSSLLLRWLLR